MSILDMVLLTIIVHMSHEPNSCIQNTGSYNTELAARLVPKTWLFGLLLTVLGHCFTYLLGFTWTPKVCKIQDLEQEHNVWSSAHHVFFFFGRLFSASRVPSSRKLRVIKSSSGKDAWIGAVFAKSTTG